MSLGLRLTDSYLVTSARYYSFVKKSNWNVEEYVCYNPTTSTCGYISEINMIGSFQSLSQARLSGWNVVV